MVSIRVRTTKVFQTQRPSRPIKGCGLIDSASLRPAFRIVASTISLALIQAGRTAYLEPCSQRASPRRVPYQLKDEILPTL